MEKSRASLESSNYMESKTMILISKLLSYSRTSKQLFYFENFFFLKKKKNLRKKEKKIKPFHSTAAFHDSAEV